MTTSVIPAKAGTQYAAAVVLAKVACEYWIPAFAGMTTKVPGNGMARVDFGRE